MTRGSDNPFPSILLEDHVDPTAPADGYHRLFIDTDEKLKMIDHASLVTDFTPGAGASVATDPIWAAAGDIAVASGNDAAAVLTKGADGTVLRMASGAVGWGLPVFRGCILRHAGTQSIPDNSETVIAFTTEDADSDGFHESATNPSRITIPTGLDGVYLVTGKLSWAGYNGGTYRQLSIALGGTLVETVSHNLPGNIAQYLGISFVMKLVATNYIQLSFYQDTTTSLTVGHASHVPTESKFSAVLLGV